ncbi:MAG TPA: 50S ribosomal protein L11 methyltransferase [Solirubrobacteraceae bacterium]|nr:50S ribosomal protein L11 methyltransferase [Solirubrobacteraceae bacterium]
MIRLALRVRREDAELALAELLALAPSGVEEIEVDDALVEYAVYGAPGELPELPDLRAAAGSALVDVSTSELPDDWAERWKRFHRPIVIDAPAGVPGLRVRPPWEPPVALPGKSDIVIDPGQAFGTGSHHTTRMCLELLLALAAQEPARGQLLDVGCGSGVLAIAAAQLGYAPVLGLDHEPASVQATQDNARANGVCVYAQLFDLRRERLPAIAEDSAPVLLANLVRPLLLDLAASLIGPPAHLIASGLLREQTDELAAIFHDRLGLRERERRHAGEWAAVWLSDPV